MISNKWYKINNHKFSSISRDQGANYIGVQQKKALGLKRLTLNKHLPVSISISYILKTLTRNDKKHSFMFSGSLFCVAILLRKYVIAECMADAQKN